MVTVQLGMIEAKMVEVLHVLLEMICALISITSSKILLNMFFFEILRPKVKPILLQPDYFTGLQMKIIFLINEFQ